MQGRRNRMSSSAGKEETGTRYFVSPTVCNQIHPKVTVRVDRVKDSKSSKPEKMKFWPGSELRFSSQPWLRRSVPGVCWDLTGACTAGRGTEASFLAWPVGRVPFLLLFSSPAWGQHHTQTALSKRWLHGEHHSLVQESGSYRPQCQHPSHPDCPLFFWPISHTRHTHRSHTYL